MAFESLTIDLNARLAKFETELRKVGSSVDRSAKQMQSQYGRAFRNIEAAAGRLAGVLGVALTVGGLVDFTRSTVSAIAALDDLSEKTGLSVELLSQLQQTATIGGQSLESVTGVATKFARSIGEASAGNKELIAAFKSIGISVEQLKTQTNDELFLDFADKIGRAENASLALAVGVKLGGKAFAESIPFLRDLNEEGLKSVRVTTEQAAAAERLEKDFARLKNEAQGLGISIANSLVPALLQATEAINRFSRLGASDAFRAINLGITGADLAEPLTALSALEQKLGEVTQARDALSKFNPVSLGTRLVLEVQIERLEKQRRLLQKAASQEIRSLPQLTEPPGGGFKIDAAALDPGAAKQREDAIARLAEARAKQVAEVEKSLADSRLKNLERFYAQGLIGEEDYWQARLDVQRSALDAERAAIDTEVSIRRQAVASASSGTADYFNAVRDLEEALGRRNRLERDFGAFAVANTLDAKRATEQYTDAVRELDARLADLEGRGEDALRIRQEAQNRTLRSRLTSNQDVSGLERLGQVERGEQSQARFNDLRERGSLITERLALAEERVQNSLRVGAISDLEALRRTGDERQRAVEQLGSIADALDQAAADSPIERLRLQAEGFRVEVERLASQSDLLRDKFDTIGETAFGDFLADAARDINNVGEAFGRMVDTITREIGRLAAQDISKALFSAAGDKGFGFGDILSKIFGGLKLPTTSAPAGLVAGGILGFQNGGTFTVGGSGGPDSQFVGFKASPKERVTITPPGQAAPGGGAMNVSIVNNFPAQVDRRTLGQVGVEMNRALARAGRRNG